MPVLKCPICPHPKDTQASLSKLRAHMAIVHLQYRRHACADCDFYDTSTEAMGEHAEETKHSVTCNLTPHNAFNEKLLSKLLSCVERKRTSNGNKPIKQEGNDAVQESDLQLVPNEEVDADAGEVVCSHKNCRGKLRVKHNLQRRARYNYVNNWKLKHIETCHLGSTLEFKCPVEECKTAGFGKGSFKSSRILHMHIQRMHNGSMNLSSDQQDEYSELKTRVKEEVKRQMGICFPKKKKQRKV